MAGLPAAAPAAAPQQLGQNVVAFRHMSPVQKLVYKAIYGARPPRPGNRYPGVWRGGRELGEGSEGVTCLWVQEDPANHHILDRVCLKDCQMDFATYHDPEMYIRDAGVNRPREFVTQKYSRPNPPPVAGGGNFRDHIVGIRSYQKIGSRCAWRIYTEFCDHGDLDDLIKKHAAVGKPFTEPFLLWVLESLAYACENMENPANLHAGHLANSQVIHQDIKMQNVFLTAPHPTIFRRHPFVKLGDFGAARLTHANEPVARNPTLYRTTGFHTEGFDPHELLDGRYYGPTIAQSALHQSGLVPAPIRMLAATNVWQIGRIILAMMRLQDVDHTTQIDYYTMNWQQALPVPPAASLAGAGGAGAGAPGAGGPAPVPPPPLPSTVRADNWVPDVNQGWPAGANYSQVLLNLVDECLQVDTADRPTPLAVRTRCAAEINATWAGHRNMVNHYPSRDAHRVLIGLLDAHRRFSVGRHTRVLSS